MKKQIKKQSEQSEEFDYNNSPIAWFLYLERALRDGSFKRAAEAQRELQRLGIDVRYQRAKISQFA